MRSCEERKCCHSEGGEGEGRGPNACFLWGMMSRIGWRGVDKVGKRERPHLPASASLYLQGVHGHGVLVSYAANSPRNPSFAPTRKIEFSANCEWDGSCKRPRQSVWG